MRGELACQLTWPATRTSEDASSRSLLRYPSRVDCCSRPWPYKVRRPGCDRHIYLDLPLKLARPTLSLLQEMHAAGWNVLFKPLPASRRTISNVFDI